MKIEERIDLYLTEFKKDEARPSLMWRKDRREMLNILKKYQSAGHKTVRIHSDSGDPFGYIESIAGAIKSLEKKLRKK